MAQIIKNLSEISSNYDAVFCDLWGVVHNGVEPFEEAVAALMEYRLAGGVVIFVTNSPRTPNEVRKQVLGLGVPERAFDGIVSGGGVMQKTVFSIGLRSYYFIGREDDRTFLSDLPDGVKNTMVEASVEDADCMLVMGPDYDTRPNARDYEIELRKAHTRKIPMYSANADRVVDHGDARLECGGAIADIYLGLGGTVFEFGKPFAGIYDEALESARSSRGRKIDRNKVLIIGDSISTDIKGAMLEEIDSLMVTNGLHAEEIPLDEDNNPQAAALAKFLSTADHQPDFAIGLLK